MRKGINVRDEKKDIDIKYIRDIKLKTQPIYSVAALLMMACVQHTFLQVKFSRRNFCRSLNFLENSWEDD